MAKQDSPQTDIIPDDAAWQAEAEAQGLRFFDPEDTQSSEPTNAVIYGAPGVGKTYLALTAPDPLLIDLEKGGGRTGQRAKAELRAQGYDVSNVRIAPINYVEGSGPRAAQDAMDQLRAVFQYLRTGNHPFRSVIIDPFSELQKLIMAEVIEKYPAKRQMGNQPQIGDWGKAFDTAISLIGQFRALPLHTIFLAHTDRVDGDDEDRRIFPLVQGKKVGPYLEGAMDLLGYLYVHSEQHEDGSRTNQRVLQVADDGRTRAKNRGGTLPDLVAEPNLTEIFAIMEGRAQ